MRAVYDIRIADDAGRRLAVLGDRWSSFRATRVVGGVGSLVVTTPYSRAMQALLRKDYRISISRTLPGGSPSLLFDQVYLMQRPRLFNSNGTDVIEITCVDCNDLLRRRIIPYYAGSAQSQVSGPIDDAMKALARENLSTSASDYAGDTSRALPAGQFTVETDHGLGPSLTAAYAWRTLLDALQDLAAAARTAGTYTTFDIVAVPGQPLQFRTYVGQRGIDRRGTIPPLSVQTGTLREPSLEYDWSSEMTVIYAGGRGEQAGRIVQTATDETRLTESVFGRIEDFTQSNGETATGVLADAQSRLAAGRPRIVATGQYQDSGALRFGRTVTYGDLVPVQMYGVDLVARLDTVSLAVTPEGEAIDCLLRNEEDL